MKIKKSNENQLAEKCPSCNGKKEFSVPVAYTRGMLEQLIIIKAGWFEPHPWPPAYKLRIPCKLCENTGRTDWIAAITRQEYNRSSASFDGCLYILFKELEKDSFYKNYSFNPNYHSKKLLADYFQTRDEKYFSDFIKFAQQRHDGLIRLNRNILKKNKDELREIKRRHGEAKIILRKSLSKGIIPTERKINSVLRRVGLSEYKPDKYAHFI
jgi:hypothetical protein